MGRYSGLESKGDCRQMAGHGGDEPAVSITHPQNILNNDNSRQWVSTGIVPDTIGINRDVVWVLRNMSPDKTA